MKKIFAVLLTLVLAIFCAVPAFAVGEGNMSGGGGSMGDGSNASYWNPGMDGVRVSVVDAQNRTVAATIDIASVAVTSSVAHFGKVCKLSYTNGKSLSAKVGGYSYVRPAQALPTIISSSSGTNIAAIKSYFTDEQVIRSIARNVGMNFDVLTNGKYKLLIEPIAYFCFHGQQFAMTATEAALYDQKVSGSLYYDMNALTHKNLPLAIFLERGDLGYPAWTGGTSSKVMNSQIISSLGLGIVRFSEATTPPETTDLDYEYRTDTDVVSSVEVFGGQADPDNPVSVEFTIDGKSYTVRNVYYPEGGSQLVWVKWHTPKKPCEISISVSVSGGGYTQGQIRCKVDELVEKTPPNPTADDRNDTFKLASKPQSTEKTTAEWGVWSASWHENWEWEENWQKCWHSESSTDENGNETAENWYHWVDCGEWVDNGWWDFTYNSYSAKLTAEMKIMVDSRAPTQILKSGYGIQEKVTARVTSTQNSAVTAIQTAVTYFPEFQYKNYFRLLDRTVSGNGAVFEFAKNPSSTYANRTHFTTIWYPNGDYTPYTYVLDCWTPTGMLSVNLTDSVKIQGNLWDDWHIAPAK